ncbi:MAG TPA: helix-turn-helix transcriptional regulator [Candidatus Bathyarchaeia archaeon]|nr:helix-turn-helix transcriptional regulator [Candidatus Bathyarchaeia archaeon]
MEKSTLKLIGAKIRQIRKEKGITQEQLAEKANTTNSYIAGVERGTRNVTIGSLEKIADALGVNVFEFFEYGQFAQTQEQEYVYKINEMLLTRDASDQRKAFAILKEVFRDK